MTGPVDPSQLPAVVAQMRTLGVTKFGDIELGPDPRVGPDEGQTKRTEDAKAADEKRKWRLKFGPSGGPRPRAKL